MSHNPDEHKGQPVERPDAQAGAERAAWFTAALEQWHIQAGEAACERVDGDDDLIQALAGHA